MKRIRAAILLLALATLGFSSLASLGCEKKGPLEKAGEKVDEAGEEIADEIDDAS